MEEGIQWSLLLDNCNNDLETIFIEKNDWTFEVAFLFFLVTCILVSLVKCPSIFVKASVNPLFIL